LRHDEQQCVFVPFVPFVPFATAIFPARSFISVVSSCFRFVRCLAFDTSCSVKREPKARHGSVARQAEQVADLLIGFPRDEVAPSVGIA
jgi:hypothetical protein